MCVVPVGKGAAVALSQGYFVFFLVVRHYTTDTGSFCQLGQKRHILSRGQAALARLSVSASLYKYPSFLKDFSWEALLPKHTPHGSQKHELR